MEPPAQTGVSRTSRSVRPRHQTTLWKWSFIVVLLLFGDFLWQRGSGMQAAAGELLFPVRPVRLGGLLRDIRGYTHSLPMGRTQGNSTQGGRFQ
jgi:hypothetical protein